MASALANFFIVMGYYQRAILWLLTTIPFARFIWDVVTSWMSFFLRLGAGAVAARGAKRNRKPLVIYEYEGCPYCRRVRDAITVLDLDVIFYPCPRSTMTQSGSIANSRYRSVVKERGGKAQFPYMIDPNTDMAMYESQVIIDYLWRTYGADATKPLPYRILYSLPSLELLSGLIVSMILRPMQDMGMMRIPSKPVEQPMELYGFEDSPSTRLVRELLCSLEIPYRLIPMASNSKNIDTFLQRFGERLPSWKKATGFCMVPFLRDLNTGKEIFGASRIMDHLRSTYQTGQPSLESISNLGRSIKG